MKILFCSDGSSGADEAVRFGALIAALASQAETTILGITEKAGQEETHLQALRRAQEILKEHHLNAELIAKAGRLIPEIIKRTRETHYDLVVIGAARKALTGPWLRSVRAYKIIETVEPPILVVTRARPALRRILLTTSGRIQAQPMVDYTADLARSVAAMVTLLHVVPEPPPIYASMIEEANDEERLLGSSSRLGRALRQQKESIAGHGVPCEFRLRDGLVVHEIMTELKEGDYDLVVVGSSPSEEKLREYVMGDVTREIVNRAEIPVMVVRAGAEHHPRGWREMMAGWLSKPKAPVTSQVPSQGESTGIQRGVTEKMSELFEVGCHALGSIR